MKLSRKISVLFLTLICGFTFAVVGVANTVCEKKDDVVVAEAQAIDTESPDGLLADIRASILSDGTAVYGQARNHFTLFPAVIETYVYLYSSTTYTEDISLMTLEGQNYVGDLDMGQTLIAWSYFNGRSLYWRAEVVYKMDSNPWKSIETETVFINAP